MPMLEIEFLGTGTSTGVPSIGCHCKVCTSTDPHDKRLRCSAIVRYKGMHILIDCGPDFRQQMLRASDERLDACLLTHIHYDHVGGLDDLRAYSMRQDFPVYAQQRVLSQLKRSMPYCFGEHLYPGVPHLNFITIDEQPFKVGEIEITPVPVMHAALPIFGYRIGPLAYITDCKTISQEQINKLHNIPLLVINALRVNPHHSHMSLSESLDVVRQIEPAQAFLIHMSHQIGFDHEVNAHLPAAVKLAHDGQTVRVLEE